MPSSPTPPPPPAAPPFPPGTLVYTFQTPQPGQYVINLAVGDLSIPVSNQTISVYDGTTFIATLFSGVSAPAGSYIDAQANVLSAAQWPILNAPVTLIFQTTQVNFVIGDGVNLTYVANIQVQVVFTLRWVGRKWNRLRKPKALKAWRKRVVFPFGYQQPMRTLVRPKRLRFRPRPKLRLIRRHLALPAVSFPSIRYMAKPKPKTQFRRRVLRCLHRKLYIPVVAKPPLFIPWRPRPRPHIHRTRIRLIPRKYPMIGIATVPSGVATPGSKVIVSVR
jgi:hypothetical protein